MIEPGQAKGDQGRSAILSAETRLAHALKHPLRALLLARFNDRVASPAGLTHELMVEGKLPADEPDKNLSNVSYHVRELIRYDCIELVDTQPRRGAVEHFYRATTRMFLSDEAWRRLGPMMCSGISIKALTETFERVHQAVEAGTFDKRDDRYLANIKADLDTEGWQRGHDIIHRAVVELMDLEAECVSRTPDPAQRFRATFSLLGYESPPSKPRGADQV
jgi:hypothetical protein